MKYDLDNIHLCDYSSHNSLQIACDKSWTTAKWGPVDRTDLPPEVYVSDDDRLYSFAKLKTTCLKCLRLIINSPDIEIK